MSWQPAAGQLGIGVPGDVVPGAVDVQELALGRGHADEVAGVVEQVAVAGLALPEGRLPLLALAHVTGVEADPDHLAPLVHHRGVRGLEPPLDAVPAANAPLRGAGLSGQRVAEGVGRVGNELLDPLPLVDVAAENSSAPLLRGAVERLDPPVAVHQDEGLQAVVEDRPQVRLRALERLLGARLLGPGAYPGQGALDGRTDPGQVALEQVVRGAGLHAADRGLFVDRAGDDEERDVRRALPGDREGGHAVEPRQGVVGEDDVGPELFELALERVASVHSPCVEVHARPAELVLDELGVHRDVLEDQDSQWSSLHVRPDGLTCRLGAENTLKCYSKRGGVKTRKPL